MNKELLYQYIKHPELLDDRSLAEIDSIVSNYPYFQSAHLLHIKNLSNQGSINYDAELKKTAVYVNDRSRLFYLLDKRVLIPIDDHLPQTKKEEPEETSLDFSALQKLTEFDNKELLNEKTKQDDELSQLIMSGAAQSSTFFNVDDKVDLEDFVNTFKKKKDENQEINDQKENKTEHRKKLIDEFILEQPKITPSKTEHDAYSLEYEESKSDEADIITDTLAKIYINQEKYNKAILAYEKLSLKYPEKNIYFAAQIQKIKELINNQ